MELKEYHYVYYSYEEWGMGYFGSRTCKCLPEEDVKYFGSFSDKNFKPTQKIILKDDYATREEAYADEITLQEYYKVVENPHFANRAYQSTTKFYYFPSLSSEEASRRGKISKELGKGIFSLTKEQRSENGKKCGEKTKKLNRGICGLTKEQRSENGKKYGNIGGNSCKKNGKGIFSLTSKQLSEIAKNNYKLGMGIASLTTEQRSEIGKKSAEKFKKLNIGIFNLSTEQRRETVKKVNSQKWMCEETGFITTSGPLTRYQKKRGIDTSRRKRII